MVRMQSLSFRRLRLFNFKEERKIEREGKGRQRDGMNELGEIRTIRVYFK